MRCPNPVLIRSGLLLRGVFDRLLLVLAFSYWCRVSTGPDALWTGGLAPYAAAAEVQRGGVHEPNQLGTGVSL